MLYSRGSDFPHNGGYLLLISFVPQKSHWIYLALCTVVIMWASQSFGAAEHTPPSLLSPISHPSSSSSSLFLSYLLPQHFLQYFFPVCRGGNSSSLNLSRGNLTARLQRLIGSNQDYWLPLCQNTFIHSHCWLLPSLARQQTPNDTLARRGGGAEVSAVAILRPEEWSELCVSLWCEQRLMTWAVQMKQQTRMVQRIFFSHAPIFPFIWTSDDRTYKVTASFMP